MDEKDSTAGLMVWQDLKPTDKDDTLRSPRYTEEPGASSELGIEVLDDAKGPVQEILTLYSVQDTVEVRGMYQIKSKKFFSLRLSILNTVAWVLLFTFCTRLFL